MELQQLVMLGLKTSIFLTVFGFGLNATGEDVLYVVRRPTLLFRSLVAMFVIMPLVAVVLARLFELRPVAEIALIALAISPVPPLLPQREVKAGGHHSYGLGLMAILALLSIAIVPLAAEILQRLFAQPLGVAPGAIAKVVLTAALIPLTVGMVVRVSFSALAARIEKPATVMAKVLLPLAVLALLAVAWPAVWAAVGDGTVIAIVAFTTAGLLAGHVMGAPDRDHSIVLALSTACRHPAIAFLIATSNFPDERVGGTILLYLLVSALVGAVYVAAQRHRLGATRVTAVRS